MKEVLALSLPILAACLAEPTLSTIDTLCVGRLSGVGASAGLAALNVNCAIFNMVACVTSFLCTATTAVVGRSLGEGAGDEPSARALRDGLLLSTSLGCIFAAILFFGQAPILSRGFGLARTGPVWVPAANYLKIRALSCPAALATLVSVGVCLGRQDMKTPLRGVLLATAVNILGDALLVWKLGCVQWASMLLLSVRACRLPLLLLFRACWLSLLLLTKRPIHPLAPGGDSPAPQSPQQPPHTPPPFSSVAP